MLVLKCSAMTRAIKLESFKTWDFSAKVELERSVCLLLLRCCCLALRRNCAAAIGYATFPFGGVFDYVLVLARAGDAGGASTSSRGARTSSGWRKEYGRVGDFERERGESRRRGERRERTFRSSSKSANPVTPSMSRSW